MRKILILRGGALGDFLVSLPALALLRQRWPHARIELVGNATAAALGLQTGLIDRVDSQHDRIWGALYADTALPAGLQARLAGYDLVINYWPDPDRTLGRHFPLSPAQIFLTTAALPEIGPAAAHYCAPLQELGLAGGNYAHLLARPCPNPSEIALHPGSGAPAKNWPLQRWASLAKWLGRDAGLPLVIISGEAEPEAVMAGVGEPWRHLPLEQLLHRLAQCRLFIGHDSGISHLAAAAGIPCLLLFGPTDPAVWAPPHPQVKIIRPGRSLTDITVPMVRREVEAMLRDQK